MDSNGGPSSLGEARAYVLEEGMPLLVQEATMDLEMGITRQRERGSMGAEPRGFEAEG